MSSSSADRGFECGVRPTRGMVLKTNDVHRGDDGPAGVRQSEEQEAVVDDLGRGVRGDDGEQRAPQLGHHLRPRLQLQLLWLQGEVRQTDIQIDRHIDR